MNIQELKSIFSAVTTFSSSTINKFESGQEWEYVNDGVPENYPLIFLEEDYLITTDIKAKTDAWSYSFILVDEINQEATKQEKDLKRDSLLEEMRRFVKYLRDEYKRLYQGEIINVSYLSLLDYEQDYAQGWRCEINSITVTEEIKCIPY
jgi:hypothetical protein